MTARKRPKRVTAEMLTKGQLGRKLSVLEEGGRNVFRPL